MVLILPIVKSTAQAKQSRLCALLLSVAVATIQTAVVWCCHFFFTF